jgi:hypothetical protein
MPEETPAAPSKPKGTCFVVMGFGKKTDFETGRTLDLDKTYRAVIKPAVKAAGLECIRADEIVHSGLIDVPMYEQLLKADVVVADLSTSNKNAYYELGVRHALRPYTTLIICEDGVKSFPFDTNRNLIRQYHHMGDTIDVEEAERFREVLTEAIVGVYNRDPRPKDSPIYSFLHQLTPPQLAEALGDVAEAAAKSSPAAAAEDDQDDAGAQTHSFLMQRVDKAQKEGDFKRAKEQLTTVREMMREAAEKSAQPGGPPRPEDPYIIQRLALVTYKAAEKKNKDEADAAKAEGRALTEDEQRRQRERLQEACEEAGALLKTLDPATSNDTETLGLWGAVHKRLWDATGDPAHLDEAVRGYGRGFYLRNDYYNGINLAFLLNVRSDAAGKRAAAARTPEEAATARAEAVADFVQARRVRREVLAICQNILTKENLKPDDKYWVLATLAEAYVGIGDPQAQQKLDEAYDAASDGWMKESTEGQLAKLRPLLADPPLKYLKTDA